MPMVERDRSINVEFHAGTPGQALFLPRAVTCSNTVHLAICNSVSLMQTAWIRAFENSGYVGFQLA